MLILSFKNIPFSGRNPVFQDTLSAKPHLLILNKMDLADLSNKQVQILAAALAESHVSSILLYYSYIYSAENPEEARKRRDDRCSLHRLLKAERPQHQKGRKTFYCLQPFPTQLKKSCKSYEHRCVN